ncbi:glutathione S-transferase family protein [Thioalkalivibrio paradoxus]|uniref:glutathione S-transferase family protein n=1 Tax=Thioalkalivibrio paradoxus TaxID=108010 RepID=UPI00022C1BB3|nr:glutathione S-transferase family protein [Thioalkalivibrio paradoxus]
MALPHLHLISFPLCPFVQRSVITLKHKNIPFERTYLDPTALPDWFLEKSPTGKVPLLIVDERSVLFESAAINEYLDEISPPRLLPEDPLERAQARAWIALASEMIAAQFRWMGAPTEEAFGEARDEAAKGLRQFEKQCRAGPCFTGPDFSLLDATVAPVLMRYELLQDPGSPWQPAEFPNLARWWQHISEMPAVRESVPDDFLARLPRFLNNQQGFAGPRLAAGLAERGH